VTSSLGNLRRAARQLRRRVLAHRRLIAGLLALLAVVLGLQAARPASPATATLTVAGRDLPAGTTLSAADLTTVRVPPDAVPDGTAARRPDDLSGRVLAAGLRRGEPVTDLRLVGPALAEGSPGRVAVPVRLPDPEMAALLQVGDHVQLLATDAAGGTTRVVAPDAAVLALPAGMGRDVSSTSHPGANAVTAGLGGSLIVVGVPEVLVTSVTSAAVRDFLTYAYPN